MMHEFSFREEMRHDIEPDDCVCDATATRLWTASVSVTVSRRSWAGCRVARARRGPPRARERCGETFTRRPPALLVYVSYVWAGVYRTVWIFPRDPGALRAPCVALAAGRRPCWPRLHLWQPQPCILPLRLLSGIFRHGRAGGVRAPYRLVR